MIAKRVHDRRSAPTPLPEYRVRGKSEATVVHPRKVSSNQSQQGCKPAKFSGCRVRRVRRDCGPYRCVKRPDRVMVHTRVAMITSLSAESISTGRVDELAAAIR